MKIIFFLFLSLLYAEQCEVTEPQNGEPIFGKDIVLRGKSKPMGFVRARGELTQADSLGVWSLTLASPKNPGEYKLKVECQAREGTQEVSLSFFRLVPKVENFLLKSNVEGDVSESLKLLIAPYQSNDPSLISLDSKEKNLFWLLQRHKIEALRLENLPRKKKEIPLQCKSSDCMEALSKHYKIPYFLRIEVSKKDRKYHILFSLINSSTGVMEFNKEAFSSLEKHELLEKMELLNTSFLEHFKEHFSKEKSIQFNSEGWTVLKDRELVGVLTKEKSPYYLDHSVIVPSGKSLTIEEGVEIKIGSEKVMWNVFGALKIKGSKELPVKIASSRKFAAGGDWQRIVIKSPHKTEIEFLELEHSNYGLNFIHSSAILKNVKIRNNKYRGLYSINSDVQIEDSDFSMGHQVAVHGDAYSNIVVERSRFHRNKSAFVVMPFGGLRLKNSLVEKNEKGLLLLDSVSLEIFNSKIRGNEVGIASNVRLFQLEGDSTDIGLLGSMKNVQGVYNNDRDFLKIPKSIVSQLTQIPMGQVVKESVNISTQRKKEFQQGFSQKEEDIEISHVGSVSMGVGYTKIKTARNDGLKADLTTIDTINPGEKYKNDKKVEGLWANTSIFSLTTIGQHSIEFSMEGRYDKWVDFWANPVTLKYDGPSTEITLGDFSLTGQDLIFSGVPVLGGQLKQKFGKTYPKFEISGGAGEIREPLYVDGINRRTFADSITNDEAQAQRVLGYGRFSSQWNASSYLAIGYSHLKDIREDPFIRETLNRNSKTTDPLLEGRALFLENRLGHAKGKYEIETQVVWGEADTLNASRRKAVEFILARENLSTVIELQEELLREPSPSLSVVQALLDETASTITAADLEAQIKNLQVENQRDWDKERVAGIKPDKENMSVQVKGDWKFKKSVFKWLLGYNGAQAFSPGNASALQNTREMKIDYSSSIGASGNLDVGYDYFVENASNLVNGSNLFGLKRELETFEQTLSPKQRHTLYVAPSFRINDKWDIGFSYDSKWEWQKKDKELTNDQAESVGAFLDPYFSGNDTLVTTEGRTLVVDSAKWNSFQSISGALATGFDERKWTHKFGFEAKWRFVGAHSIRLNPKATWVQDYSIFEEDQKVSQLTLADTTWEKLGYYYNGFSYFEHQYPVTVNLKWKKWSNRSRVKYRLKDLVRANEATKEWSASNRVKWKVFPRVWVISLETSARLKNISSQGKKYFAKDATGKEYEFYHEENGIAVPDQQETANNLSLEDGVLLKDGFTLFQKDVSGQRKEIDLSLGLLSKYNINSRFYVEVEGRVEDYLRPDALSEQYRDFSGSVNVFYSF